MQKEVDEFKAATLDRLCIIAASDVGQTAKLIAVCEALGASPEQMATIVGRATRAMQMARKELRAENCADAQKTAPIAQEIAPSAENCAQKIAHGAKSCASSAENCASPARGVVPNPTTVECVSTQDRSPSPLPPYSPPIPSSPRKCDPDGVTWDANSKTILLDDGNRAFWLDLFEGDAARLDLALIEAAGSIQPNSRQLLALQVGRSLSRIVADRKDRDRRYANAAAAKQASPAQPRMDLNTRKAAEVAELRRRMKAREEAANAAHH